MPRVEDFVLSRQAARAIDQAAVSQLGMTGLLLMENAARGVCDLIRHGFSDARTILIACGPGNNGGDGLALARQLAASDITASVHLVRAGKTLTHDAAVNHQILAAAGIAVKSDSDAHHLVADLQSLTAHDLIVDCLLGTGVTGAVREPFQQIVTAINQSPAQVLAVDVPSGLDCDTGTAAGVCVQADRTITFVGQKQGFQQPTARPWTGQISVAHIGLPAAWVARWLGAQPTDN